MALADKMLEWRNRLARKLERCPTCGSEVRYYEVRHEDGPSEIATPCRDPWHLYKEEEN